MVQRDEFTRYFMAIENPKINIARVPNRVHLGGHSVPEENVARCARSLALLPEAIRASNRAFLLDNSGTQPVWFAESTDGRQLQLKSAVP